MSRDASSAAVESSGAGRWRPGAALWLLSVATVLFHLLTVEGYGYFRDELYYLACGRHLDFGYVDHPPLIGLAAAVVSALLGESLLAIRLLPALAAGVTVFVAGALAGEFGGGRFASLLAGAAAMLAPLYLSLFSVLSMNAFDLVFWALLWWLAARILRTGERRLWLAFGAVAGIALENKISVLFLGLGVVAGLVAARRWQDLRSRWLWLGGAVAGLLFLPHLLWQAASGWPTLEFMANARRIKIAALSPPQLLAESISQMNPLAAPVWLAGLAWLLVAAGGRPHRALGWAFVAIVAVMTVSGGKAYYLGPAYLVVFAAGAVAVESWRPRRGAAAVRAAAAVLVVGGGGVAAPVAKPLLPADALPRYAAWIGADASAGERHEVARLPQFFADMHGWAELAATVAEVFHALPPEDRWRACIYGQNYGQAGAIDLFADEYELPPAISGHNSYFLWGPGDCTGEVVIVIGGQRQDLERLFAAVELATTYTCVDCMPYENGKPIWVARGPRQALAELWAGIKTFI